MGAMAIRINSPAPRPASSARSWDLEVLYAVPGVQMQELVLAAIIPDLQRRSGDTSTIFSRTLRTWGERVRAGRAAGGSHRRADGTGNPTLACNLSGIEGIKLRLTAKGAIRRAAAEHWWRRRRSGRSAPSSATSSSASTAKTIEASVLKELRGAAREAVGRSRWGWRSRSPAG